LDLDRRRKDSQLCQGIKCRRRSISLTGETIYKSTNDRREIGTGVVAADRKVARNPEFNNYTIEGNALLEDVLALLESPAEKSTANIAIKRKLIERKLRHFLQNAVPKFDVKGL